MGRLIDADALIEAICRDECERSYKDCDYSCSSVAPVINAPTVDAQPVRRGKWIYVGELRNGDNFCAQWDCSVCGAGQTFINLPPFYQYCPICGAKMEE